jgi:Uma2 family endonuclease
LFRRRSERPRRHSHAERGNESNREVILGLILNGIGISPVDRSGWNATAKSAIIETTTVCLNAGYILNVFVREHGLGRVMSNDSGVITERDPDTVRGADVAYDSYDRLPKGPLPTGYGPEVPELVVEVRSANDGWRAILEKVAEYLRAGVLVVVVLDPEPETAHVFGGDEAPRTLGPDDELVLPDLLESFRVRVGRFFE